MISGLRNIEFVFILAIYVFKIIIYTDFYVYPGLSLCTFFVKGV